MDEIKYFMSEDGARLMYRRWLPERMGEATPIVLLHGAASNSTRWWHFITHSQLAIDRFLIRPDLRGHGESLWRGPAGIEDWSQDIAELLQQEQKARAIIVGHCLGANIALNFASRFPDKCAGLVLIEPIAREAVTSILARFRSLIVPVLHLIVAVIKLLNRLGIYRRQLEALNLRLLDRRVHEADSAALQKMLAEYGSPKHDLKFIPAAQYFANLIEIMRALPISEVRCPSLVIQSSGKSVTDPARTQILLQELPDVKFATIDSEHWLPATHPDQLCTLIDNWVLGSHAQL